MAKHRKTRKEKVMSDQRKSPKETPVTQAPLETMPSAPTISSTTPLFSVPNASPKVTTIAMDSHEYDYVTKDLRKTTLLTLSLIVAQVILAFILKI